MAAIEDILRAVADEGLRARLSEAWLGCTTLMPAGDPAQALVHSTRLSVPTVFDADCYICRDPEYAQMGMSLCWACPACGGHVAADDGAFCGCGGAHPDYEEVT